MRENADQNNSEYGHFLRGVIGESRRLISDIIEVCDIEILGGYLMTTDFEKAFDSMNHAFLIAVLKNMVLVTLL